MKKIIFGLLLIFAINIPVSFSNSYTFEIKNFFENKLQKVWNYYNSNDLQKNEEEKTSSGSSDSLLQKNAIEDTDTLSQQIAITNFLSIKENFIEGKIDLSKYDNVQKFLYITFPEGNVLKFSINDIQNIFVKIPLSSEGKYQFEILNTKGFPIFFEEINSDKKIEEEKNEEKNEKKIFSNIYEILDDINSIRKKLGYSQLQYSPLLQKIAIAKIEDMIENNYIGHNSPDGKNIFNFVDKEYKIYFSRLGENISGGKDIDLKIGYQKILNSPAHRLLLLNSDWKKVGIAYVQEGESGYFVQIFSD